MNIHGLLYDVIIIISLSSLSSEAAIAAEEPYHIRQTVRSLAGWLTIRLEVPATVKFLRPTEAINTL